MTARHRTVVFVAHPLADLAAERFTTSVRGLGMREEAVVRAAPTAAELASAAFIVAFAPDATLPDRAEVWPAEPEQLAGEVADLVARLFTGAARDARPAPAPAPSPKPAPPKKPPIVKVSRETKGRRGKGVTLISEFPTTLGAAGLQELAATLKSRCGTGGAVKDGIIEIQGDQRERVAVELEKLGYKVKHAGG